MKVSKHGGGAGPMVASAAMLLLAAVVFFLSGVPGGNPPNPQAPPWGAAPPLPAPALLPLNLSSQLTGNAHVGEVMNLNIRSRPQVGVWTAVSTNSGPSMIGPWSVALSSDWNLLLAGHSTDSFGQLNVPVPIPPLASLHHLEFVMQTLVYDPATIEFAWTNPVLQRITNPPPGGRNVLLLRQTLANAEAQWSQLQADLFSQRLTLQGHSVVVVDDFLPTTGLADFDCILDCRFTTVPPESEKDTMQAFLQLHGGLFLLSGPYVNSPGGQLRRAWVRAFLAHRLGIPLIIGTGSNASNMTTEVVNSLAPVALLAMPNFVVNMNYVVTNEGGTFGSLAPFFTIGDAWINATSGNQQVYGAAFRPEHMPAIHAAANVVVLLNGHPEALASGVSNPNADLVLGNLPWALDH